MSVIFIMEDSEVLKFDPREFRRVHLLEDEKLKYSHSDLIIIINAKPVMVEIVSALLDDGRYEIKINEMIFSAVINKTNPTTLQWIKKLIFINFPDLPVSDVYCNKV
jgi:hypothetical protein